MGESSGDGDADKTTSVGTRMSLSAASWRVVGRRSLVSLSFRRRAGCQQASPTPAAMSSKGDDDASSKSTLSAAAREFVPGQLRKPVLSPTANEFKPKVRATAAPFVPGGAASIATVLPFVPVAGGLSAAAAGAVPHYIARPAIAATSQAFVPGAAADAAAAAAASPVPAAAAAAAASKPTAGAGAAPASAAAAAAGKPAPAAAARVAATQRSAPASRCAPVGLVPALR